MEKNKRHRGEDGYIPHKEILSYGLDRITHATILDKTFVMKKDFDMKEFYKGCTGIIPSDDPIEHVVLIAYGTASDYLRTLPLHKSQQEIGNNEESTTFSYDVKLTYDFLQLIMQQGDQVEVLEPKSLRDRCATSSRHWPHIIGTDVWIEDAGWCELTEMSYCNGKL